jgi:hypothetical protein
MRATDLAALGDHEGAATKAEHRRCRSAARQHDPAPLRYNPVYVEIMEK